MVANAARKFFALHRLAQIATRIGTSARGSDWA